MIAQTIRGVPMKKRRGRKPKKIELKRDLKKSEIEAIEFLWRWKVAPASLLKEIAFSSMTAWTFYKTIRQLKKENILMEIPRGKFIFHRLLALTELGYEIYLRDRDYNDKYRFRVHAPAHDYLASAMQLAGVLKNKDPQIELYSEQELQTFPLEMWPKHFQSRVSVSNGYSYSSTEKHFPDGLTVFRNAGKVATIGYEVEINLKPKERYRELFSFWTHTGSYDFPGADIVLVLVRTPWIANKIISYASPVDHRPQDFAFISLDDFILQGWEATVRIGRYEGLSIRKIHENLLQKIGKDPAKLGQMPDWMAFFPKYRSPQKSITYTKPATEA